MSANDLTHQIQSTASLLKTERLGLKNNERFEPVNVSLTPYQITTAQWKVAFLTARSLGKLFTEVGHEQAWMTAKLNALPKETLARRLMAKLPDDPLRKATSVNLSRHDLVLNQEGNWKLIETNSIAAGMGPFSESLIRVNKQLDPGTTNNYLPNEAAAIQAKTLFQAASNISKTQTPTVVFVIEERENNIYDQQKLADELSYLGAQVHFKTLADMQFGEKKNGMLAFEDLGTVDLLYLRTGYNLADYEKQPGDYEGYLHLRASWETLNLALCPSITGQLASNKWIQMSLSSLSIDRIMSLFSLTAQEAILASMALNVRYHIPTSFEDTQEHLDSDEWILKSQNEGGGSVINNSHQLTHQHIQGGEFLMQRINAQLRPETIYRTNGEQVTPQHNCVTELGVFTAGKDQQYAGYLARTKANNHLETGVHKGFGMVDTIVLEPQ